MAGLYWTERPPLRRAALFGAAWLFCWLSNPYFGVAGGLIFAVLRRSGSAAVRSGAGALRAALAGASGGGGRRRPLIVVVPIYALYLSSRGEVELLFTRQKFELLLVLARGSTTTSARLGDSVVWNWVGNPFASSRAARGCAYPGAATIVLAIVGIVAALGRLGAGLCAADAHGGPRSPLFIVPLDRPLQPGEPAALPGGRRSTCRPSSSSSVVPFIRAFARLSVAVVVRCWPWRQSGPGSSSAAARSRRAVASSLAAMAFVALEAPGPTCRCRAPSRSSSRAAARATCDVALARVTGRPTRSSSRCPGARTSRSSAYFMIGQTVHGHRMTNGSLVLGSLGQDFQNLVGDPRQPDRAGGSPRQACDLLTVSPWAYGSPTSRRPGSRRAPPPASPWRQSFEDGSAIWRVTATPADAVPIFRTQGLVGAGALPDGRIWRWMDDEGHVTSSPASRDATASHSATAGWARRSQDPRVPRWPEAIAAQVATGPESGSSP